MNTVDPTPKGFFKALFDFSFKSYITPKIIKIIFGIVIVIAALGSLFLVIVAFNANAAAGVVVLVIVAPIVFLFYVIIYRVSLEVVMAVFTIAENTTRMAAAVPAAPYSGAPVAPPASPGWSPPPAPAP